MQVTQFLGEAGIYGEAIKIQILPSMWTSQGQSLDSLMFVWCVD